MERSRVVASTRPEIWDGLGALLMEKERVVPRQPLRPHVPFVVGRVLFMVGCSFYLQNKIVV